MYDKPLRGEQTQSIYRPSKSLVKEHADEYDAIKSTDRFRADKGFTGTESGGKREAGPVQFEKVTAACERTVSRLLLIISPSFE